MLKRTLCLLCAVLMVLGPFTSAIAKTHEAKDRIPIEVVEAVFENEDGETVEFKVADGGSVIIKNAKLELYFRLNAQILDKERVEFRLQHYADAELDYLGGEEVFEVGFNEQLRSAVAPFKITVTGTSTALATPADGPLPDNPQYTECCIWCGEWIICCGVHLFAGYICCTIYTACFTCTVCEFELVE